MNNMYLKACNLPCHFLNLLIRYNLEDVLRNRKCKSYEEDINNDTLLLVAQESKQKLCIALGKGRKIREYPLLINIVYDI